MEEYAHVYVISDFAIDSYGIGARTYSRFRITALNNECQICSIIFYVIIISAKKLNNFYSFAYEKEIKPFLNVPWVYNFSKLGLQTQFSFNSYSKILLIREHTYGGPTKNRSDSYIANSGLIALLVLHLWNTSIFMRKKNLHIKLWK